MPWSVVSVAEEHLHNKSRLARGYSHTGSASRKGVANAKHALASLAKWPAFTFPMLVVLSE